MFGQKTKLKKAAFNADVLTTFGKLSQQDIDKIDGQTPHLVAVLIEQYGWAEDVAQRRVVGIGATLSKEAKSSEMSNTAHVSL